VGTLGWSMPGTLLKLNSIPRSGAVAQLGERLVRNEEATGSIPVSSTNLLSKLQHSSLTSRLRNRAIPIGVEPYQRRVLFSSAIQQRSYPQSRQAPAECAHSRF
jgi:hypothetical protein